MWQIKREDLIPSLETLSLVPEKLGIPSSEYFWVRGKGSTITLSVASYIAGEVTITGEGKWPIKGDFYIDRRVFLPFINVAKESKDKHRFEFVYKHKQLIISHGSRKAHFLSQDKVKGYGNLKRILKDEGNALPISDDLKSILSCGTNCAVSDAVVPHLNCVYLKSGKRKEVLSYASSEKLFYFGKGKIDDGKISTSIPFPLFLIPLLSEKGLRKISWKDKFIVLKFKHGYIWQTVSQEAIKDFPIGKIQKSIKKSRSVPTTFIASSRRFSRIMLRLGYYLQSVRRKDWVIKVKGNRGESFILVTTDIPGTHFVERISTSDVVKKTFELEWPLHVLEPMFNFLSLKTKKLGVIVRVDHKHGVSYIEVGNYWLSLPSRQE